MKRHISYLVLAFVALFSLTLASLSSALQAQHLPQ